MGAADSSALVRSQQVKLLALLSRRYSTRCRAACHQLLHQRERVGYEDVRDKRGEVAAGEYFDTRFPLRFPYDFDNLVDLEKCCNMRLFSLS